MAVSIYILTNSAKAIIQKKKYHILMHVYGITKNGTDEPIFRAELETQIQILDAAGEGQGGTN